METIFKFLIVTFRTSGKSLELRTIICPSKQTSSQINESPRVLPTFFQTEDWWLFHLHDRNVVKEREGGGGVGGGFVLTRGKALH